MEAPDERVQRLAAGQALGVPGDVDHAGVTAAGDDDQPLARDVDDERLVVQHQRIGLPALIEPGLLRRKPGLVPGGARNLPRDQHGPAEQEARRLVVGISSGSRPGSTIRRRRQKCGWISTGMFTRPSTRISPSSPVVWSKCPWLQTIASIDPGSKSS